MARVVKEQAKDELPDTSVEVLDSQNVTAAEGKNLLGAMLRKDYDGSLMNC